MASVRNNVTFDRPILAVSADTSGNGKAPERSFSHFRTAAATKGSSNIVVLI